jgi:hypothetical protein
MSKEIHSLDCLRRQIVVGGSSGTSLLHSLAAAGVLMNEHAHRLLAHSAFPSSERTRTVEIALLSVGALGHAEGATMPVILRSAADRGLLPGALELAPHFRLQYADQPEAPIAPASRGSAPLGSVTVVSLPISDDPNMPRGFYLRCMNGERWLRGYCCDDEHVWDPGDMLAFVSAPSTTR